MRARTAIAAAALTLTATALAAAGALSLRTSAVPENTDQNYWNDRINACAQLPIPELDPTTALPKNPGSAFEECARTAWEDANDSQADLNQVATAWEAQAKNRPNVWLLCHGVAHSFGYTANDTGRLSLEDALTVAATDGTCASGVVHGAFTAEIKNTTADEQTATAQRLAQLCLNRPDPWGKYNCVHGVGHGYGGSAEYVTAAKACAQLLDWQQAECSLGAMMQQFAAGEGGTAAARHSFDDAAKLVTTWCPEAEAAGLPYEVTHACWQAGALEMSGTTTSETMAVDLAHPDGVPAPEKQRLAAMWKDTLAQCRQFPAGEPRRTCREWIAVALTGPRPVRREICAAAFPKDIKDICLEERQLPGFFEKLAAAGLNN